ncbi:MAG TPA: MaoC family dehydratase [Rhizomicrobium sp.]|jgi:acyl dehydratase|nr:MaoC family dehydratase [Rhizomicrobium sp.]
MLLHFEDLPVGRVFECGPYNVTREEIFEFASEFDPQPHHLDEDAAQASMLKGLSASGWHVCAMAMRMFADDVVLKVENRGGAGAREARWMKPVRPGDMLRMEAEVVEAKPSQSKPIGFVTFDCRVYNEEGQVALISMTPIIGRRGP